MTEKKDIIDAELLDKVCNKIEQELKNAERADDDNIICECISEIDFYYGFLRRYNSGCLPFRNNRFKDLDKKVKLLKD